MSHKDEDALSLINDSRHPDIDMNLNLILLSRRDSLEGILHLLF